ncbi:MAG TPA: hypothetical protein VH141_00805 [Pseudonocardia sp.]|jgi:hypothetical protein|nr:hypothetical protein [Pseudonocardia sp.]
MGQDIERRLRELHEHYIFEVNQAVEEGREGDIAELVAHYPDEAAQLMAAAATSSSSTWSS